MKITFLVFLFVSTLSLAALAEREQVDDSTGSTVDQYFRKEKPSRKTYDSSEEPAESNEVHQPYKEAEDGLKLREMRRVGVGLQAAGALGIGGAILDLNFAPQWSATIGYGGGEGFQTFEVQGKYVLAGTWIMPYASFGYARWSSIGKSSYISKSNPPVLADRLLNDDEKAAGEFTKNLIYPGIGLQFTQLNGEWAGTSIYAELTVLLDVGNAVAAPTGALGMAYYF